MSEQREWFEIDYSKSYTRDNHRGETVEFDGFLIPAPSDLLSRAEWEASTEVVVSGSVATIIDYEAAYLWYYLKDSGTDSVDELRRQVVRGIVDAALKEDS